MNPEKMNALSALHQILKPDTTLYIYRGDEMHVGVCITMHDAIADITSLVAKAISADVDEKSRLIYQKGAASTLGAGNEVAMRLSRVMYPEGFSPRFEHDYMAWPARYANTPDEAAYMMESGYSPVAEDDRTWDYNNENAFPIKVLHP